MRVNPVRGCIQSIRGGGTVCVLGLTDDPAPVVFKELIWKEAQIIGSRVTRGEFSEVIEHMDKGNLNPDILISDIIPATETQYTFEAIARSPEKYLKVLLDLSAQ